MQESQDIDRDTAARTPSPAAKNWQAIRTSSRAYGADLVMGIVVVFTLILIAGLIDLAWGGFPPDSPVPTVCFAMSLISPHALFVLWAGMALTQAINIVMALAGRNALPAVTSWLSDRLTLTTGKLHQAGGFLCGGIIGALAALYVLAWPSGAAMPRGDLLAALIVLLTLSTAQIVAVGAWPAEHHRFTAKDAVFLAVFAVVLLILGRFFLGDPPPMC